MGLIKASIEYQKTLEDLGDAIAGMPSEIEEISDLEQRGMFKYLQSEIEKTYEKLKESSKKLLDEIDKNI